MVSIRLARGGAPKRPFYHVVVTDSRKASGGKHLERIGFYNPMATKKEVAFQVDKSRVEYWLYKGAQPTPRVASLISAHQAA